MASSGGLLSPPLKDREPLKCVNDPNFAVICAFLEEFGTLCAIEHPNFEDLQTYLENDEQVHADLIDLHVKLLRKLKFSVNVERWERSLAKFCYSYSMNDAWELERFAYKLLKLPTRLRILKNLLETQFDSNVKFKGAVNVLNSGKLRKQPLGSDKMGNVYWRTLDSDCNIRIYQENQDEESLRIVASNRDELAKLIAVLSGKEPMSLLAGLVDEDSSSNSDIVTAPVAEEPKGNIVQQDAVVEPLVLSKKDFTPHTSGDASSSRITLLGKNNLAKINKFKLMNTNEEEEDEASNEDEEEEDEEDGDDNMENNDSDSNMDIEPEVSSVIQERVVYIRGEGSGRPNKCGNPILSSQEEPEEFICGEAIEEPMMFVSGDGAGRECDMGNPGDNNNTDSTSSSQDNPDKSTNNNTSVSQEKDVIPETPPSKPLPKPMFFFGRPGCLKLSLSPMKTPDSPKESTSVKEEEKEDKVKINVDDTGKDEQDKGKNKFLSLVAYDDSNSGESISQDDSPSGDGVKSNNKATESSVVSESGTSESIEVPVTSEEVNTEMIVESKITTEEESAEEKKDEKVDNPNHKSEDEIIIPESTSVSDPSESKEAIDEREKIEEEMGTSESESKVEEDLKDKKIEIEEMEVSDQTVSDDHKNITADKDNDESTNKGSDEIDQVPVKMMNREADNMNVPVEVMSEKIDGELKSLEEEQPGRSIPPSNQAMDTETTEDQELRPEMVQELPNEVQEEPSRVEEMSKEIDVEQDKSRAETDDESQMDFENVECNETGTVKTDMPKSPDSRNNDKSQGTELVEETSTDQLKEMMETEKDVTQEKDVEMSINPVKEANEDIQEASLEVQSMESQPQEPEQSLVQSEESTTIVALIPEVEIHKEERQEESYCHNQESSETQTPEETTISEGGQQKSSSSHDQESILEVQQEGTTQVQDQKPMSPEPDNENPQSPPTTGQIVQSEEEEPPIICHKEPEPELHKVTVEDSGNNQEEIAIAGTCSSNSNQLPPETVHKELKEESEVSKIDSPSMVDGSILTASEPVESTSEAVLLPNQEVVDEEISTQEEEAEKSIDHMNTEETPVTLDSSEGDKEILESIPTEIPEVLSTMEDESVDFPKVHEKEGSEEEEMVISSPIQEPSPASSSTPVEIETKEEESSSHNHISHQPNDVLPVIEVPVSVDERTADNSLAKRPEEMHDIGTESTLQVPEASDTQNESEEASSSPPELVIDNQDKIMENNEFEGATWIEEDDTIRIPPTEQEETKMEVGDSNSVPMTTEAESVEPIDVQEDAKDFPIEADEKPSSPLADVANAQSSALVIPEEPVAREATDLAKTIPEEQTILQVKVHTGEDESMDDSSQMLESPRESAQPQENITSVEVEVVPPTQEVDRTSIQEDQPSSSDQEDIRQPPLEENTSESLEPTVISPVIDNITKENEHLTVDPVQMEASQESLDQNTEASIADRFAEINESSITPEEIQPQTGSKISEEKSSPLSLTVNDYGQDSASQFDERENDTAPINNAIPESLAKSPEDSTIESVEPIQSNPEAPVEVSEVPSKIHDVGKNETSTTVNVISESLAKSPENLTTESVEPTQSIPEPPEVTENLSNIPDVEASQEYKDEREVVPVNNVQADISEQQNMSALETPSDAKVPETEDFSDNDSEGGHFDGDYNEPMEEEDDHKSSDEEEQPLPQEANVESQEPVINPPEEAIKKISTVPLITSLENPEEPAIAPLESSTYVPEEDQNMEIEDLSVRKECTIKATLEDVSKNISPEIKPPVIPASDSPPKESPPEEPFPTPVITPVEVETKVEPVPQAPIPQEHETVAPAPRPRRGRRSDPVVAELGITEVITEGPRTTRGRSNNKESPKSVAVTPPQPRKNSRKRKSEEHTADVSAVKEELAVQETVSKDSEVTPKVNIPEVPLIEEIIKPVAEVQPPPITVEAVKVEPEVTIPIKHESEVEDEDEEEVVKAPTSGRKAPARGGRKGRKGRKAPPAKAKVASVETVVKSEEVETPVKEEHIPERSIPTTDLVKEEPTPSAETPETPSAVESPSKPKKGRRQNRMMGLYMDEIQPQEDVGSVRQSRRIAQIKIKEETDRRLQEEVALVKMKDSMKGKPDGAFIPSSAEEDSGSEEGLKGGKKGKGKKGKKPEKEKKAKTTWHSNSNSSAEDDEEKDEDEYNFGVMEEDPGSPLFKSDHEFSCESDVDGDEYVPTKMARTARKGKAAADDSSEEEDNPDHACQKCGKHDHPEWILLCDTCDKGYHCSCLLPVLFIIPTGDWNCPQCSHAKLLEQLTKQLEELDNALTERDNAILEREKDREREAEILRKQQEYAITAENILPKDTVEDGQRRQQENAGSSTRPRKSSPEEEDSSDDDKDSEDSDDMPIYKLRRRKQTAVSYRFNDYDELINKAIRHDMRDDRRMEDIFPGTDPTATEGQETGEALTAEDATKPGNLGRGKDISTIMEAEDNEKTRKELSQSDGSDSEDDVPLGKKRAANVSDSEGSEPIRKSGNKKNSKNKKGAKGKLGRKKNRKLNNLDSSSDDDGSDEDFKGSSADTEDSEEEVSGSLASDSSMELAMYRKKGKKGAGTTRRSGRARVKRFDKDFINDDDDDSNSKTKAPPPKKRKKKEESDFSDFDETDEEAQGSSDLEEQDLDSADLCDDSESESSGDRPWGSKKKKKPTTSNATKVFSKKPIQSAGKVPRTTKRKGTDDEEEDDDEKPFKASLPKTKKKKVLESDDDEGDEGNSQSAESSRPARRTRGKKMNFMEMVESGSSDDGIKPGVKRPDTPPEERAEFIKRQEEIKKMLAAKNTQAAIQAATPKLEPLKLKLSGATPQQDPDSLSTIPRNIIQSAKALDTEYHQKTGTRDSGDEFDDELPDDFNPEDMDEEDLDRMMEEGDFAVQQLKLAGDAMRSKKQQQQKAQQREAAAASASSAAEKSKLAGSAMEQLGPVSAQPPQELLAHNKPGYPLGHPMHHMMGPGGPIPHSVIQGMPPKASHLPPPPHLIPDGQHPQQPPPHPHPMHLQNMSRMPLMAPQMMHQGLVGGPPGQMHGGMMPGMPPAGPSGMPQNVIVGPGHNMPGGGAGPSFPPYGGSPGPVNVPPSAPIVPSEPPKAVPKKRGRKPKDTSAVAVPVISAVPAVVDPMLSPGGMQIPGGPGGSESVIPTTVMAHETATPSPTKKGRRKKITPSREELAQAAQAASSAAQAAAVVSGPGKGELKEAPRGSILSERLEGGDPKQTPPPVAQNLIAQPPYNPSVITRLPQPGQGAGGPPSSMAGPYPGQGAPPRFYQHQGVGGPPSNAPLGMHHMPPQHGQDPRMQHFMQQHPRHMPPHMYRPPTSIYGNPYQGQHAPPPHLQRPQLDPHGPGGGVGRPMHPQDFSNSYLPPQFGPYIPGHHSNPHIRGPPPTASSSEEGKGKSKGGPLPTTAPSGPPPAPHPAQLAHYEALKAAGGPMYNPPYPGGPPVRHPGEPQGQGHPDAPNRGEFSGLVSYFSAQHDDLDQQ